MKRFFVLLILIIFSLTFSGCKRDEIKIGFAGGLTGVNSELSISGMYGASLAAEEINNSGGINGKNLKLVIKDDKNDKDEALKVDKEIVDEKCVAIIGHFISSVTEKAVPFVNDNNILMISPTISTDGLNEKDDNFLRVCPSVNFQADALYKFVLQKSHKKIMVFYSEDNYLYAGNLNEDIVKLNQKNNALQINSVPFSKSNLLTNEKNFDFLKSENPDGVIIFAAADDTAMFCKELKKHNIKTNIYFSTWSMTNDLIEHGGAAVEGASGINFVDFSSKSKKYISFNEKYKAKFGIAPDFSAICSYESVMVLKEALTKASSTSAADIKKAIIDQAQFDGIQNTIYFNRYGDCIRNVYLCSIENEKFIVEKLYEQ